MTEPTIPEPVASFIEAVNRHDEAAFLDAFTSNGTVDDWGRVFTGRDEIKRWSEKEFIGRSEEHTSELQSRGHLVCRLLLEKKKKILQYETTFGLRVNSLYI